MLIPVAMRISAKKRSMVAVVLAVSLFAASGCVKTNKTMDSWMGHPIGEVIRQWGPPSSVTEDGYGGKVYTWASNRNFGSNTNGYVDNYGNYHGTTRDNSYTATRSFYVRKGGEIYAWRWHGV